MRFTIQLVIEDENNSEIIEEVIQLEKDCKNNSTVGITLLESKQMLKVLQNKIVLQQAKKRIESQKECSCCHKKRHVKDYHSVQFRTLFGIINMPSPRLFHCRCDHSSGKTFSPLNQWLSDKNSPELQYIETKWASLISYQSTAKLLQDILPVGQTQNASTVRNHLQKIAKRKEKELEGKPICISGCANQWAELPKPDKPITVGIDGGYVRSWMDKQTNFEVIIGKSFSKTQPAKRFGLVQAMDKRPQRRLLQLLRNQGMQENQQITFLSDGADNVRDLQFIMHPEAEHVLDWFHLTMRFTVLQQFAKGLAKTEAEIGDQVIQHLTSAKGYLWHGNVEKALDALEDCYCLCDIEETQYNTQGIG